MALKTTKLSRIVGYGGRRIKKVANKKKYVTLEYKNLDFFLKTKREMANFSVSGLPGYKCYALAVGCQVFRMSGFQALVRDD